MKESEFCFNHGGTEDTEVGGDGILDRIAGLTGLDGEGDRTKLREGFGFFAASRLCVKDQIYFVSRR